MAEFKMRLSRFLFCLVLVGVSPAILAQSVAILGAPNTDSWNDDVVAKVSAAGSFTAVDGILVSNSTPTLAELQAYDSVLVYSDGVGFSDPVGIGDVLADYVDAGGAVVVATFSFNPSGGISLQGRLVTDGYLPWSQAAQSAGSMLTMVPVAASDPLLDGVDSFNGGTSSYHNVVDSVVSGATLVAEWDNGQPLVARLGSVTGLNFYPPSSDARSDFWDASTDGGQLMANALGAGGTVVAQPVVDVPTLGGAGKLIMIFLMFVGGFIVIRRLV